MHHYQAINRRIKHEINFLQSLSDPWVPSVGSPDSADLTSLPTQKRISPNTIRAERSEQEVSVKANKPLKKF
jgi:hypothetical protein